MKTLKMAFPSVYIKTFSGGACPQSPLKARAFGAFATVSVVRKVWLRPCLLYENLTFFSCAGANNICHRKFARVHGA